MASAAADMGEIDEDHHSKEEGETIMNGDLSAGEISTEDSQDSSKKLEDDEPMEVDHEDDEEDDDDQASNSAPSEVGTDVTEENEPVGADEEEPDEDDDKDEEDESSQDEHYSDKDDDDKDDLEDKTADSRERSDALSSSEEEEEEEVHEIIDDDDDEDERTNKNGLHDNKEGETIELNDSGDGEGDGDVMIIEETNAPKENGSLGNKRRPSDELEVIELNSSPIKKRIDLKTPRRSVRNLNKQRSYIENERLGTPQSSEESDIEEVFPQDPLAVGGDRLEITKRHGKSGMTISTSSSGSSSTIVVKDTKRLVEIAAKSNSCNTGNKKEPTLVIIDTNSILSGRGPVPANKSSSSGHSSYPTLLPMALPAQGMYPPNMRATITPIPISSSNNSKSSSSHHHAPVLPTLTDDMFVVEAPSFIVPYVYEKPPVSDFKDFVKDIEKEIKKQRQREEKGKDKTNGDGDEEDDKVDADEKAKDRDDDDYRPEPSEDVEGRKPYSYFESPLGKFFIDIGFNLVQEYVQTDLLKQQKRKRDREGGNNPTTNKTIHSLIKNLEFSKENNVPFKIPMKKCEFCHFKTESMLAMAHHLEQPHTKNYVYKCNFCAHEVRSPHDILFHMEAEHTIRGRLERAPAFHQCPNCPFEDNQKGKLSRHLVACMRKFKPEKNLDPPIDWEPPAKIPRVPKQRQNALNASAYQAMKTSQMQILSKMQLMNNQSTHPLHRGRGRPTSSVSMKSNQMLRPSGMVYKQTSGGSVLVPTNYQLSGNQVYQVVGGGERLGHPGHLAFVPNIPSASTTVTLQQNQKSKSMHQPSISITPLPRASSSPGTNMTSKPGDTNSKNSFVICEICDGYIKDLEQLRNHMQWIHKVKIHPKMIYNRPPLNCQKCQFRFFTDQGLERHLLGSHGLVTSSMQDAANKSKDAGRCPVCGRVYQWKLLNHVARDHNMTLKPAHLSYKCTVCTATFGMYKQFENHVYSAHSVVAKRVMDKKNSSSGSKTDQLMKPLKINDEITIIPQPAKSFAGTSKEGSPSSSTGSTNSRNSTPSTSKNAECATLLNSSKGDKVASCSSSSTNGGANN